MPLASLQIHLVQSLELKVHAFHITKGFFEWIFPTLLCHDFFDASAGLTSLKCITGATSTQGKAIIAQAHLESREV